MKVHGSEVNQAILDAYVNMALQMRALEVALRMGGYTADDIKAAITIATGKPKVGRVKKPVKKTAKKRKNGTDHKIRAASKGVMPGLILDAFQKHNYGPIGINTILMHVLKNKPTSLKQEPKRRMLARVQTHVWALAKAGVLRNNGKVKGTNCNTWTRLK